jgi:N,N'-diacetyl-8-epilegionaminate cytidylyltransferase
MKINAFIFARGGSKGLKNKNIKSFMGFPLIYYPIQIAKEIKDVTDISISSDSDEILRIGALYGANKINRPKNISTDVSPEILAWKHAINYLNESSASQDFMLSLPATSPLRDKKHILQAIEILKNNKRLDGVIGVTPSNHHPNFNMVKIQNGAVCLYNKEKKYTRRQDAYNVYNITTNFYLFKTQYILNTEHILDGTIGHVEIPKINAIDIDDIFDFKIAETLFPLTKLDDER